MSDQKPNPPRLEKFDRGSIYESYVGRWSRIVAPLFLKWLDVPTGARWLDVGCGTGAISQSIVKHQHPRAVTGIDPSAAFVAYGREQIDDERVTFVVGDAQRLPLKDNHFDAIVSGLVLNFIPDRVQALAEMRRVSHPGSIIAAYVWDYAERMEFMRCFWDVAVALRPQAAAVDEGSRFTICKPEPLTGLFQQTGLEQVEVRGIEIDTHFRDFDDYWTPFLGGQGSAPGYVQTLSEGERLELRESVRARLPINADGSINMAARVWAVRGVLRDGLKLPYE